MLGYWPHATHKKKKHFSLYFFQNANSTIGHKHQNGK